MDFQQELAVKSYCFREFKDAATLAKMVLDCGVNRLDISRCHLDFTSRSAQQKVIDTLRSAGITIVGLGVVTLQGDEAADRPFFEFCRMAGCRTISISFEPAAWAKVIEVAGRLCGELDMRCAIHNHGGHHWLGNRTILKHLFDTTPNWLGLCLDTAWALDAGEDPVAWARSAGPRLTATHLKDFVFDRAGTPTDVVLGEGGLNLPAYIAALRELNFDGPLAIEYEGDANDPVPALRQCVQIVRKLL